MATVPRGYIGKWVQVPGSAGTWNKPSKAQYVREYTYDKNVAGYGSGSSSDYTTPSIDIPSYGSTGSSSSGYNVPTYSTPTYNTSRISEYRTKALNPQLRGIRNSLRTALVRNRVSDNPYAEALRQKQLLSGTGESISSASSAANKTALSQYAPEYQAAVSKAAAKYKGALQRNRDIYQGNLETKNLAYTAAVNAAMAKAKMQHQAKMAELQASLKSQYGYTS